MKWSILVSAFLLTLVSASSAAPGGYGNDEKPNYGNAGEAGIIFLRDIPAIRDVSYMIVDTRLGHQGAQLWRPPGFHPPVWHSLQ